MKKKKMRPKYGNIIRFLLIVLFLFFFFYILFRLPITNIYISGNTFLSDNDIIRQAKIENYPSIIKNNELIIKKRLLKNKKIYSVNVKYKFTSLYIEVNENYPLFYDSSSNKTILYKGNSKDKGIEPYLINYVPDNIYDTFVKCMRNVDKDILYRISEIKYDPNKLDEERFYLIMLDGNHVYININNFNKINKYDNILKKLNNKKGILYLDSGEYFEIQN